MEEPLWARGLEALAELRGKLEGELQTLLKRRPGLARKLEALNTELASMRRQLELVEAKEKQLAAHWRDRPAIEGWGPRPSTQVRGSA
jgi:uncharacterized protein involved in exopolysaccharide biosynthesis